ncbi:flagellar filament capping protein FliD [soil metagenome]
MTTESITKTLGVGSGIDISALVQSLVDNQFSVKKQALTAKADTLTSQISDAGKMQSGISSFTSALSSLVKGGTLATQPTSSNTGVLNATALSGAKLASLSATVEVRQLASAQAATTTATDKTKNETIGNGTLTPTFGKASVDGSGAMTGFTAGAAAPIDITIDDDHKTMEGVASAINAAKAGVTATVVSDSAGARLMIKSASGEEQAFTLDATEGATPGLSALNIGVGATGTSIGSAAKDAIVALDGVALKRDTNSISDLIPGVKLDLVSVSTTPVTLGSTRPTAAITQAVSDFVATYNEYFATVKTATDPSTGSLRNDMAAKALQQGLQALTLTEVTSSGSPGAPLTLAGIGIGTNRDGTLTVDSAKLTQALNKFPDEFEAMFADGTAATGDGLFGTMTALTKKATSAAFGLAASTLKYNADKTTVTAAQTQEVTDEADAKTRLTTQFASMDSKVAAYKATQSFLDQQIAAWNNG